MSEQQPATCERCKKDSVEFYCEDCQPFHSFCMNCDRTVHSFPSKTTHARINAVSPKTNEMTYEISRDAEAQNKEKMGSPISMNNSLSRLDCNTNTSDYGLVYTREYVNELKRNFEKERSEFQFKINNMHNTIERLKSSFQTQVQQLQDDSVIVFNQNKLKEDAYENKIKTLLIDKNETIDQLIEENNAIKDLNNELNDQMTEQVNQAKDTSNTYMNHIESLKNEIDNLNKTNNKIQNDNLDQVQSLMKDKKEEIEMINDRHHKEKSDMMYEHKYQQEQLRNDIETSMKEVQELTRQNNEMRAMLNETTKNNEVFECENNNLKENNDKLIGEIQELEVTNEGLRRNLERERNDSMQMKDDFDFFERTITNLKKEVAFFKDFNTRKDNDYNALMNQTEKMRKDNAEKTRNNERLEERINRLIRDNGFLQEQLKQKPYNGMTYELK